MELYLTGQTRAVNDDADSNQGSNSSSTQLVHGPQAVNDERTQV